MFGVDLFLHPNEQTGHRLPSNDTKDTKRDSVRRRKGALIVIQRSPKIEKYAKYHESTVRESETKNKTEIGE